MTEHGEVTWQTDSEFIGANHAEHAMVGDYELLVFDLPADPAGRAVVGWELFGPPRHQELIAQGEAQTLDAAKAAAERALGLLLRPGRALGIDCPLDQHPDRLAAIRRICPLPRQRS